MGDRRNQGSGGGAVAALVAAVAVFACCGLPLLAATGVTAAIVGAVTGPIGMAAGSAVVTGVIAALVVRHVHGRACEPPRRAPGARRTR